MTDIVVEILSIIINMFAMMDLWLIMSLLFGCDMRVTPRNLAVASGIFLIVNGMSLLIFAGSAGIVTAVMFAYNVLVTLILTNKNRIKTLLLEVPAVYVYAQFGMFCNLIERLTGCNRYSIGVEKLTPSDLLTDLLLFVLLVLLGRTRVAKSGSIQLTLGEGALLTMFCFFGPSIVEGLEWFEGIAHSDIYKMAWICFMIVLNVAVVYAIVHRKMATYYRRLSGDYKKEFEKEYSLFKDYRERQEDMARFRHDWNNHMLLLQEMLEREDYAKAENYFRDLTAGMPVSVYRAATGNELLDMVLSTRMTALEEGRIELQCEGAVSELDFMSYVDGCVLFSNLIDNAIEANVRVKGARYIRLKSAQTEKLFYLEIRNPMEGTLRQAKGRILTTKAVEEGHGIGLQNVNGIVEKYNGECRITAQDHEYVVQLVFPLDFA